MGKAGQVDRSVSKHTGEDGILTEINGPLWLSDN